MSTLYEPACSFEKKIIRPNFSFSNERAGSLLTIMRRRAIFERKMNRNWQRTEMKRKLTPLENPNPQETRQKPVWHCERSLTFSCPVPGPDLSRCGGKESSAAISARLWPRWIFCRVSSGEQHNEITACIFFLDRTKANWRFKSKQSNNPVEKPFLPSSSFGALRRLHVSMTLRFYRRKK